MVHTLVAGVPEFGIGSGGPKIQLSVQVPPRQSSSSTQWDPAFALPVLQVRPWVQ
jgi:hypothetical protein